MTNFTPEDLLLYLYKETTPRQTSAIEKALEKDWTLREKLTVLKTSMQRLDKIKQSTVPRAGDRRGYQMDPANVREAVADVEEGADLVIVKPGLPYPDVIRAVRERVDVPVVAYQVSGEFAMLHAAAERGWIDLPRAMEKTCLALRRAGADLVITYFARDLAMALAGEWPAGARAEAGR